MKTPKLHNVHCIEKIAYCAGGDFPKGALGDWKIHICQPYKTKQKFIDVGILDCKAV
jgi:hypothetical protein